MTPKPQDNKTIEEIFDNYRESIVNGLKKGLPYPDVAVDAENIAKKQSQALITKAHEDELKCVRAGGHDDVGLLAEARIDELIKAFTQVVGDETVSLRSKFVKRFTKYLKARYKQLKENL